jgi:hypothetical protein
MRRSGKKSQKVNAVGRQRKSEASRFVRRREREKEGKGCSDKSSRKAW